MTSRLEGDQLQTRRLIGLAEGVGACVVLAGAWTGTEFMRTGRGSWLVLSLGLPLLLASVLVGVTARRGKLLGVVPLSLCYHGTVVAILTLGLLPNPTEPLIEGHTLGLLYSWVFFVPFLLGGTFKGTVLAAAVAVVVPPIVIAGHVYLFEYRTSAWGEGLSLLGLLLLCAGLPCWIRRVEMRLGFNASYQPPPMTANVEPLTSGGLSTGGEGRQEPARHEGDQDPQSDPEGLSVRLGQRTSEQ